MLWRWTVTLFLLTWSAVATGADFDGDAKEAIEKLNQASKEINRRMEAGDFAGATEAALATFPAETRTAAQAFMLGNMLFETNPKESYSLHKAAAAAAPDNATVVWEWALQQHRAGEYAGALASYEKYSASRPQSAAPYALQADCLLRLNRIEDATIAWRKSEEAPRGTIETMESLVCTVHREPAPFEKRAKLLKQAVENRDAVAAADLIALDCDFPHDWWNRGPIKSFLAHDLSTVLAAVKLNADDVRTRAMACAAECAINESKDAAAIKAILKKHQLLIDDAHTIPEHGGLLMVIVESALSSKSIDNAYLEEQIGPQALKLARSSRNTQLWNVAAGAGLDDKPDELLKLEREAWQATGDVRFAKACLFLKSRKAALTGDDPDLVAALKQFPECGEIWRYAYEAAKRDQQVTKELLANAAKAEFTHFSSFVAPMTVVERPRSNYLRSYFGELQRMSAAKN